jgi:Spt4/RpoE2 zinc finger
LYSQQQQQHHIIPIMSNDNNDREMMGDDEEEELPQQVMELADAPVPTSLKGIRACKRCGLLKTVDQFINEGCENCSFLEMVSGYIKFCSEIFAWQLDGK